MTALLRHHLRHWPYYLAFAVLLALVDPVARGLVTCARQDLAGCPGEIEGGWR